SAAGNLRQSVFRAEWRADGLFGRLPGYFSASRGLCRAHPAGPPPRRSAGPGAGQIHTVDQSQGSRRHRPDLAADTDCPRRRGDRVRRRDFIALAGGVAAWPLAARAQHDNRVRHVGVFMNLFEGDPEGSHRIAALLKSLDEFGWTEGRNIRLDFRWGIDADHVQKNAEELVALNPDVIVAASPPAVLALKQIPHAAPIVFVAVTD